MKTKIDGINRRKFIKAAAATAYVAPLIASMPAHATFKSSGSNAVKPKFLFKKRSRAIRIYKFKKYYRRSLLSR